MKRLCSGTINNGSKTCVLTFAFRRYCQVASHFDYERVKGTENAKWLWLTGKQSTERFIPITRKALLRKILEDASVVGINEMEEFQQFATKLDSVLYIHYKKRLDMLKSQYNPLSSDRDTVQMKTFTQNQLIEREKDILHKLAHYLTEAGFYELPNNVMLDALGEDNVAEKVVVSVSPEDYEILRFWVVGMDLVPLDDRPWYVIAEETAKSVRERGTSHLDPLSQYNSKGSFAVYALSKLWKKMFGQNVRRIARYKRVVVAVRQKTNTKLLIKAFKDIPCENLEFLLPGGKIKMGTLDKIRLSVQSAGFMLFILATTITTLTELKLEMSLILGLAATFIFGRNIAVYKHMRNRYVLNMSQTLYFKSVASNHALLSLIIDRAEDEVYKSALLVYSVLHKFQKTAVQGNSVKQNGMSEAQLKEQVEEWINKSFDVTVNLSLTSVINFLENWNIIEAENICGFNKLCGVPLEVCNSSLPDYKRPPLLHHADLLNINIARSGALSEEQRNAYLNYEGRFDWR